MIKPGHTRILQQGFSLVELMIALTLGLLITAGVISVFLSNRQSYATNTDLASVQDNMRVVFETMSRDIRQAGLTGCGNPARIANVLNNGPNAGGTVAWYANLASPLNGYGPADADPAVPTGTATTNRVAGTDSLQTVESFNTSYSISSHDGATGVIAIVEAGPNISQGDLVVVCDPDHAVVAQVSSFAASPPRVTITSGGSSPGNCAVGLGYFTDCSTTTGNPYQYAPNALISRLQSDDWYIGVNPLGGTSLYLMTSVNVAGAVTTTTEEIVRNVSGMSIQYLVSGASSYVSASAVTTAANWPNVIAAQVTVTVNGAQAQSGTNATPVSRTFTFNATVRTRVV